MKCIIELTQFNITDLKSKKQFIRFVKKYLINTYKRIIINNNLDIDLKSLIDDSLKAISSEFNIELEGETNQDVYAIPCLCPDCILRNRLAGTAAAQYQPPGCSSRAGNLSKDGGIGVAGSTGSPQC